MQYGRPSGAVAARTAGAADMLALVRWFARRARHVDRLDRLGHMLDEAGRELGFRYFALVQHGALEGVDAVALQLTNYPPSWRRRFAQGELHRVDPVQRACATRLGAFRWSELGAFMRLTEQQRSLLRESRGHGLGAGLTVPLHVPGARKASLSLATEPGGRVSLDALFAAQLLAPLGLEAAQRLLGAARRTPFRLSPRQRQCVALLAAGLTDRAIADRLDLSEETVTKYVNAARRRHGLARRTQLVAAALRAGEIGFDEIDRAMAP